MAAIRGFFLLDRGRQQAFKIYAAALQIAAKFAPKYYLRINPRKRYKTPKKGFKRKKTKHGEMLKAGAVKCHLSLY